MREFDFDELDRAVHSVLGSASTAPPEVATDFPPAPSPTPAAAQKPAEEVTSSSADGDDRRISSHVVHARVMPPRRAVADRLSLRRHQDSPLDRAIQGTDTALDTSDERVATVAPDRPTPTIANEAVGPQPQPRSLSRKRSGRVMDIVLPADGKTTSPKEAHSTAPQYKKPSRPVSSFDFAPVATPVSAAPSAAQAQDSVRPTPEESTDRENNTYENASSPTQAKAPKPLPPSEKPLEPAKSTADEKPSLSAEPRELKEPFDEPVLTSDTPFISAAQVEKRPLGGGLRITEPATSVAEESSKPEPEVDIMQEKIRQIESMDFSEALEPEGQQTDVAVSDIVPSTQPPKSIPSANAAVDSATFTTEQAPVQDTPAKTPSLSVSSTSVSPGPTSITRQYKAETRVASAEDTSPIFDPESYHQPLAHEPKRKSGWGIVIGIVALLLVGAVIAAVLWWSGILPVPM